MIPTIFASTALPNVFPQAFLTLSGLSHILPQPQSPGWGYGNFIDSRDGNVE